MLFTLGKSKANRKFKGRPPNEAGINTLLEEYSYLNKSELKEFKRGIYAYEKEVRKKKPPAEKVPSIKEKEVYKGVQNESVWCFFSMMLFGHK